MSSDETSAGRPRRERSARYPGVPLGEAIELCRALDGRGLDGLPAAEIAAGLGYKNIKTNTFSARISAARQFGLLELSQDGYGLTPLAREILHPVDTGEVPRLHKRALLESPLYSDLAERLGDKKVPEAPVLANLLYHHYQITASAKLPAAEAFLESARFAGALGPDQVFRPRGEPPRVPAMASPPPAVPPRRPRAADVRIDLRLWDRDEGKVIRLRAPERITRASFERFLQAFRLQVRIEEQDG
jgi:hypothetical protein